ncbi:hypothetical protein GUJ93_ZPchr0008g11727 [Zizania palustris]|uniref:Uncharacterized protein n=1 Tax=Zizania palustris TaxID=103762 RepID=A0A8J5RUZ4_ZIZPA|nr:hypothetical protein GUJ93_ZPchr0008g11727 [Zizania palustris]
MNTCLSCSSPPAPRALVERHAARSRGERSVGGRVVCSRRRGPYGPPRAGTEAVDIEDLMGRRCGLLWKLGIKCDGPRLRRRMSDEEIDQRIGFLVRFFRSVFSRHVVSFLYNNCTVLSSFVFSGS